MHSVTDSHQVGPSDQGAIEGDERYYFLLEEAGYILNKVHRHSCRHVQSLTCIFGIRRLVWRF